MVSKTLSERERCSQFFEPSADEMGKGGLDTVTLHHAPTGATAEVYLLGAHVTSFHAKKGNYFCFMLYFFFSVFVIFFVIMRVRRNVGL